MQDGRLTHRLEIAMSGLMKTLRHLNRSWPRAVGSAFALLCFAASAGSVHAAFAFSSTSQVTICHSRLRWGQAARPCHRSCGTKQFGGYTLLDRLPTERRIATDPGDHSADRWTPAHITRCKRRRLSRCHHYDSMDEPARRCLAERWPGKL